MTQIEIQNFRKRVSALIEARRLRDAFAEMKGMSRRRMAWEVTDAVDRTEQNYAYMLQYMTDGASDPGRQTVYDGIVADLYRQLDMLVYFMEKVENTSQYYSTVRTLDMRGRQRSIAKIIDEYTAKSQLPEASAAAEALQTELFKRIWVAFPLTVTDIDALTTILTSPGYNPKVKVHVISAVMLGLMHLYDRGRLQLLMDAYINASDVSVAAASLTGLLLGLWRHSDRPLDSKLAARMAAVKEVKTWPSDLQSAFIEMIRARDTERINKKMRDEVIPKMINLRPDIMNKINDGTINPEDLASLQENPEWEELLDKTGITDKLKELTEIQMEGGDVFMSTFAHLKTFPFFSDIANWFLPFSTDHSAVRGIAGDSGVLADMVEQAMMLCDSDKYSFMFALAQVGESQRKMMTSQLDAQREQFYEQAIEAANTPSTDRDLRRRALNSYMQNIYRFYKLFPRRNEFFDPFLSGINLIAVPGLAGDFTDTDRLQVVAEFYFKHGYLSEALEVFDHLEAQCPGDAARYQKMGYCYEKQGRIDQAVEYYRRAELLEGHNLWTQRRLAACYRSAGDKAMAEKYYKQLAEDAPDDLALALLYGYVLTESGKYREALKQFYKVEYLDEKSSRSWRPLAWTLFLTGDLDGAAKYYGRIIMDGPSSNDYFNMGHVALASGNVRDAINYYRLSIDTNGGDRDTFRQALLDDTPSLRQAGVDTAILPLVADAVLYSYK